MEGAEEVLSYLAERYALYVVTNGVERTQRNRLRLSVNSTGNLMNPVQSWWFRAPTMK